MSYKIEIGVYITVVISLLGIALPILTQIIARLENKYSSEQIVDLFNKERERIGFLKTLYIALILIVVWSLQLEPIILLAPLMQIDILNFLINNSADILLAISSIILVIFFFGYIEKALIYYSSTRLIRYLEKRYTKRKEMEVFIALSDILLLSIKMQERNIPRDLKRFFYSAFSSTREEQQNRPVEYPNEFYSIVHKSVEELVALNDKRTFYLERSTAGGVWLLGENENHEISELTYAWLWRNLLLAILYERDEMVVNYWENAHNFFDFSLPSIHEEVDFASDTLQVSNKETVDNRNLARERFLEFHYALGGLLNFHNRYSCMKRIFNHSMSIPPNYVLFPETMNDIFYFFFKFLDSNDRNFVFISSQYRFTEQGDLNTDDVIKRWIVTYIAILFIRHFTITPSLYIRHLFVSPELPKKQRDIQEWIRGLDYFRKLVDEHLENNELLEHLGLNFVTKKWCEENERPYPIDFIDTLKAELNKAYKFNATNLPVSKQKVQLLGQKTKEIIENKFNEMQNICTHEKHKGGIDLFYANGISQIQNKDPFTENPEVHHCNYDTVFAEHISSKIEKLFPNTFFRKKRKTYLLKPLEMFEAVDKLELSDDFIIVAFGFNIDYYIEQHKVQYLTKQAYRKIPIYSYTGTYLVSSSLFIVKKSELPYLSTRPISKSEIDKFELDKESDNLELYTSVIDLNVRYLNDTADEIFNKCKEGKSEDELRKSILLNIFIIVELQWKKKVDMIMLTEYSEYIHKGLPSHISEVKW
ncbi:MAG: hypothetical protein K8S56_00255 [Candidatus Cloacimonetes bacterium]|nr:hypothetical protein [Candidatus Cloacimonadota bacterium]